MRIFKHYISWYLALLVVAEILIAASSLYTTQLLRQYFAFESRLLGFEVICAQAFVLAFAMCIAFYILGLYDLGLVLRRGELLLKIGAGLVAIFFIIASVDFLMPSLQFHSADFLLWTSIFLPITFAFRLCFYWAINLNKEKVLILGVNTIARNIATELAHGQNHGFEIQGFVAEKAEPEADTLGYSNLGLITELESIVREHRPNVVVVALSERRGTFPYREILDCKLEGIRVEDWPTFYEKLTGKILIQNLRPSWLIFADGFTRNHLMRTMKRLTDILLALVGLCVSLPIMALLACLIKLDSRGSVFFRQERVGEKGKVFTLFKFRTMVQDAEKDTGPVWSQNADPRTTRLGRMLRRTGLDEIPQMFNVLKGDMSFVGPRPERPHFVAELQQQIPYYAQRSVVRPGITGWAQVRYGYGATLHDAIEKLHFDLYYIKNMSFFLDMLIILSTVHKVLFAKVALQTLPQTRMDIPTPQDCRRHEAPQCAAFEAPVAEGREGESYAQVAQRQER
ncbi:MAG: TIGR03013 family XrtA/PEP-CTERM system glycosyltransferase [Candidatus Tectimicrobiota bacterium]